MNAGTPTEAMVDFTGGVHMCVQLANAPPNLWDIMYRAAQSTSLIGCGTPQGVIYHKYLPPMTQWIRAFYKINSMK